MILDKSCKHNSRNHSWTNIHGLSIMLQILGQFSSHILSILSVFECNSCFRTKSESGQDDHSKIAKEFAFQNNTISCPKNELSLVQESQHRPVPGARNKSSSCSARTPHEQQSCLLTCMVVLPPSSRAMARRMLSWNTRSLDAFIMRSMTRLEAPSLSRWHWTSARLISPLLMELDPEPPPRKMEHCSYQPQSEQLTFIAYLPSTNILCTQHFSDAILTSTKEGTRY